MAITRKLKASRKKKESRNKLSEAAISGLAEKKGHEIVCLDIRKTGNSVADFFVICHGDSKTQVDALAKSVEEIVWKETKENPIHIEGTGNAEWVVLDYFNVVVHIFLKERREFYGIERLWADAEIKKVAGR